jgi:hypothetical protein
MFIKLSLAGGMGFAVIFSYLVRLTMRGRGNSMKNILLAVTLLAFLVVGSRGVQAQAYGPYYGPYWDFQYQQYLNYLQWQEYLQYLQQYDPYYELHVMHYQLYLQPYQPYQIYQPCCFAWGAVIPDWSAPISPRPRPGIGPRQRPAITPRSQAPVSPPPGATGSLPRATAPLPRATSGR